MMKNKQTLPPSGADGDRAQFIRGIELFLTFVFHLFHSRHFPWWSGVGQIISFVRVTVHTIGDTATEQRNAPIITFDCVRIL